MRVNDDFDLLPRLDDGPGPARRISSTRAAELVRAAMAAEPTTTAAPVRRSPRRVALLAAALLAIGGVASAGIYTFVIAPQADAPAPAPVGPKRQIVAPAPAPEPEPEFEILDDEVPAPAPRRAETPQDLLRLANARRKAERYADADELYQRVVRKHAGTDEAYVAMVASAQLRLDQLGKPASALRLYRRALRIRPSGALAEEARYGVAEAHRALGDEDAEADALAEFLERHPSSPLRERAKARYESIAR